jgi:hypothetical protein
MRASLPAIADGHVWSSQAGVSRTDEKRSPKSSETANSSSKNGRASSGSAEMVNPTENRTPHRTNGR